MRLEKWGPLSTGTVCRQVLLLAGDFSVRESTKEQ